MAMTWIVFAAGGEGDDAWEEEKEIEAHDINGAIEQCGFEPVNIIGVINQTLSEEFGLEDDGPEGDDGSELEPAET